MKVFQLQLILAIFAATHAAAFRLRRGRFGGSARAVGHGSGAVKGAGVTVGAGDGVAVTSGAGSDKSATMTKLKVELEAMVVEMMDGKGPSTSDISKIMHNKMDFSTAVSQLDGKLPQDVASLVKLTKASSDKSKSAGAMDEDSMQKARRILNDMILAAWGELDDVIFECKEFQERNRGTYEQVVADLARLGSQLSKLGENRVDAGQGIVDMDRERKDADERLENVKTEFTERRYENSREMSVRKNDLAVFDFVLKATACKDGAAALVQSEPQVSICSTKDGPTLNFKDAKVQAKIERMMTPEARLALREALGQASAPLGLLQESKEGGDGDGAHETTTALPTFASDVVPVSEDPHPAGQWKKCVDGTPNCGLLHDLMSLEWGKFRDGFDELTAEMNQNQEEYDSTTRNINEEITSINDQKTRHMEVLANTISSINADTEEMNEKDQQERDLTHEFDTTCAVFREKITEILYTKICAVRKVRNELLVFSIKTPPSNISDCDFTDWHSKTGECIADNGDVILCDDTCPRQDPYKCGGSETMKRDIVVVPDSSGMKCPKLEREKKCRQKKCPIDCLMSAWSGWSKCTKDCESGVETKTRSVLTKPKNGGMGCDSVQEERPCNTGSCDRDCTLLDWGDWSPCSMACGGGDKSRTRKVLVPIRGQGKCPKKTSPERLEDGKCNTQPCAGDEICVAKQDLVIALDGSGSLKEKGFKILQTFAANLTLRYEPKYWGTEATKIGVSLFGNGHLLTLEDGTTTIQPAVDLQGLTYDFAEVRTKIEKAKWQRGFTNMAQGLTTADTILAQGGRADAQSAVLVISDGKYSFKYQTAEKVQELKDKNIMIFMAPVSDGGGGELEELKKWASQPWHTNYERIPGLAALRYNMDIYSQKLLEKFCPDSISPSLRRAEDKLRQYILAREDGWPNWNCAGRTPLSPKTTKDDCAEAVRKLKQLSFAFGKGEAAGKCYAEKIIVDQDYYDTYSIDQTDPKCPRGGKWDDNKMYDTYIINPETVES